MRTFEIVSDEFRKHPKEEITLPVRATNNSAGYDFFSVEHRIINPGKFWLFWTDVKACVNENEYLAIVPRSSLGIKKSLMLKNTIGIIDQDYYNNESNNGNIIVCLYNFGKKITEVKKGERIAQGIFSSYLTVDSDNPLTEKRVGGIGSTNVS